MGLNQFAAIYNPNDIADLVHDLEEMLPVGNLYEWRKHPDLEGWMEKLYRWKGGSGKVFNCASVHLGVKDLAALEVAVNERTLPKTTGFFFGESYESYLHADLEFIAKARQAIAAGFQVFYSSSW